MDTNEEQAMEIEALKSIYMQEEFTELSTSPHSFKIHLVPTDFGSTENLVEAGIIVTFTEKYPNEVPIIQIENIKGMNAQRSDELQKKLLNEAQNNLGMAMIFTLAQSAKDYLLECNEKVVEYNDTVKKEEERRLQGDQKESDYEEEINVIKKKILVEEEVKKGTIVTVETFNAWKKKFDIEMAEKEREKNFKLAMINAGKKLKLTGRQLFESDSSMATSDLSLSDDKVEEDSNVAAPIYFDQSAFEEDDDTDLQ